MEEQTITGGGDAATPSVGGADDNRGTGSVGGSDNGRYPFWVGPSKVSQATGDAGWDGVTAADGDDEDAPKQTEETFRLKHLGEEFTATREEVVALAQKGRDYDRIRARSESLAAALAEREEHVAFIRELAAGEGMTAAEFIDARRAADIARREGLNHEEATARVRAEREAQPDYAARNAATRREREIESFLTEYGNDFDPKLIPSEVWDEVKHGKTLLQAYQSHENRTLKDKLRDAEQQKLNAARSIGSRATDGGERRNRIETMWYSAN
ncbi:MAG: hypothetical protein LBN30_04360 [Oscillospiraceae bacterium]|jgi:hypothetical protein|nr:hypothetical protein [Oscillospiraceae bacterium]